MNQTTDQTAEPLLNERLATSGFRFTPQRQSVYAVLLSERDHPTAEDVFIRAKREMPEISLATVYNCLEAFVKCGLARQVTVERGAARFCPNMREHSHFYCDVCVRVFDLPLSGEVARDLPPGFRAVRVDLTIHGSCPDCESAAGLTPAGEP
ncbi:MAG: transcriptional repressor [Verrucomicrobiota bacterium]|jgi:Fur family peroxide stress response transcriptional regulator|nr:transcriptional repressor [Verrucomicrobiota bacterium]